MNSSSLKHVENFEAKFLLLFTEEIIRATSTYKNIIINRNVKAFVAKKEQQQKQALQIRKPIPIRPRMQKTVQKQGQKNFPFKDFFAGQGKTKQINKTQTASIEETELPAHLRYLKPVPSSIEIDLKKLMPLVRDPLVRVIECNGQGEKIIVTGGMGRKNTPISLTKEEIDEVINTFSSSAKIPINEGIFKVVYGKLLLSAIVSEVVGSRFIIRKMDSPQSAVNSRR